jgi:hypothetical protein
LFSGQVEISASQHSWHTPSQQTRPSVQPSGQVGAQNALPGSVPLHSSPSQHWASDSHAAASVRQADAPHWFSVEHAHRLTNPPSRSSPVHAAGKNSRQSVASQHRPDRQTWLQQTSPERQSVLVPQLGSRVVVVGPAVVVEPGTSVVVVPGSAVVVVAGSAVVVVAGAAVVVVGGGATVVGVGGSQLTAPSRHSVSQQTPAVPVPRQGSPSSTASQLPCRQNQQRRSPPTSVSQSAGVQH